MNTATPAKNQPKAAEPVASNIERTSISLPKPVMEFALQEVHTGGYTSFSNLVADLIRERSRKRAIL